MFHIIEFVSDWWTNLERSPGGQLEHLLLRRGSRWNAEVRPSVFKRERGTTEKADLRFEDGTLARGVPYFAFTFVDAETTTAIDSTHGERPA
jgi:hypothetical protein